MMVSDNVLLTVSERVADIHKEISGVKSQYNITDFELKVLRSLENINVGSHKQRVILADIEKKVFGESRVLEPRNKSRPDGSNA